MPSERQNSAAGCKRVSDHRATPFTYLLPSIAACQGNLGIIAKLSLFYEFQ